jgi:cyclophilin family peptidyl-prolyl cis-trans isomerase
MKLKLLGLFIGIPLFIFVIVSVLNDKNFGDAPYKSAEELTLGATDKTKVTPPTTRLDITKGYQAVLKTTEGDITIKLYALDTPVTVTNFVYLSKLGFYNNTIFHRVIKDFMIQGGDPRGNGTGDPGYTFKDEQFDGTYTRGIVAMANSGPNTNGSQFFIMHQDRTDLPKNYVIFGKVTKGLEVLDKIANSKVVDNGSGELSKPETPVTITSVDIIVGE